MATTVNLDDPFNVQTKTKQVSSTVLNPNAGSAFGRSFSWSPYMTQTQNVVDQNAMAGQVAVNYGRKADASIAGMLGAAQNGINSINSQAGSTYPYVQQAAQAYDSMGQGITGTYGAANDVRGLGQQLTPYMETFRNYGDKMFSQGDALIGQGNGVIGQGQGILGMNANMGGLGGEYVKWLQSINPNSFVSMAAADTQRAGQNAQGQMDRSLSRSGVDAGSARSAALKQQYAQSLQSALAGAKTRARMQGLQAQGAALQGATGVAGNLIGAGAQLTGQGLQAQNAAGQMQQNAVQAGTSAGNMLNAAGQLQSQGAQLQAAQGRGYGDLISSQNQTLGLTLQAQQNLTQAQNAAAQYYAQTGQGWGQVAGSGGIMSALFG